MKFSSQLQNKILRIIRWGLRFRDLKTFWFLVFNIMINNSSEDLVFFDWWGEELSFWQSFLLSMWSIATCCITVAQLVQSLATMWFPHSTKHLYPIPQGEVVAKPTQVSLCLNPKLATQFEKYLLFVLLKTIVINHNIPRLPRTPLMLWHLRWMNKYFMHLKFCNHWTKL
jgi:hypothetical protein